MSRTEFAPCVDDGRSVEHINSLSENDNDSVLYEDSAHSPRNKSEERSLSDSDESVIFLAKKRPAIIDYSDDRVLQPLL